MMIVDTHCHLDAAEFDLDRENVIISAIAQQVSCMVVPAVERENWQDVIQLANRYGEIQYALGIHPMYVDRAEPEDINLLAQCLAQSLVSEKPPVAIGEIGLDYFVTQENQIKQIAIFTEQLEIAKQTDLPVILHVRKAVDDVLKYLRRYRVVGGIAHAFNGSLQQAHQFIDMGFALGFGGAMTYSRALHLRELAKQLPLESIVLETDAPDIPPEWVGKYARNQPAELLKIAHVLAEIRGDPLVDIIEKTSQNACRVLPKLSQLYTSLQVLH